jgi:hypothetical protein
MIIGIIIGFVVASIIWGATAFRESASMYEVGLLMAYGFSGVKHTEYREGHVFELHRWKCAEMRVTASTPRPHPDLGRAFSQAVHALGKANDERQSPKRLPSFKDGA